MARAFAKKAEKRYRKTKNGDTLTAIEKLADATSKETAAKVLKTIELLRRADRGEA